MANRLKTLFPSIFQCTLCVLPVVACHCLKFQRRSSGLELLEVLMHKLRSSLNFFFQHARSPNLVRSRFGGFSFPKRFARQSTSGLRTRMFTCVCVFRRIFFCCTHVFDTLKELLPLSGSGSFSSSSSSSRSLVDPKCDSSMCNPGRFLLAGSL